MECNKCNKCNKQENGVMGEGEKEKDEGKISTSDGWRFMCGSTTSNEPLGLVRKANLLVLLPLHARKQRTPHDAPCKKPAGLQVIDEYRIIGKLQMGRKTKNVSSSGVSSKIAAEELMDYTLFDAVEGGFEKTMFTESELLHSSVRHQRLLDSWSPYDLAVFEAGVCAYGKVFHKIQKFLPNKSVNEIVELFYYWKAGSHYSLWKKNKRKTREPAGLYSQREKLQKLLKDFQ
eukprot:jgi/Bigna1/74215/fgenesh1_pg.28_\